MSIRKNEEAILEFCNADILILPLLLKHAIDIRIFWFVYFCETLNF